ncbi:MAG: hypothetical protein ACYDCK_10215 [Thermoplasmatota archaeon]
MHLAGPAGSHPSGWPVDGPGQFTGGVAPVEAVVSFVEFVVLVVANAYVAPAPSSARAAIR